MKEKTWFLLLISLTTALPLILFNYFFLREFPLIFQAINLLVGFLIAITKGKKRSSKCLSFS